MHRLIFLKTFLGLAAFFLFLVVTLGVSFVHHANLRAEVGDKHSFVLSHEISVRELDGRRRRHHLRNFGIGPVVQNLARVHVDHFDRVLGDAQLDGIVVDSNRIRHVPKQRTLCGSQEKLAHGSLFVQIRRKRIVPFFFFGGGGGK
jgi:hypothetical protein